MTIKQTFYSILGAFLLGAVYVLVVNVAPTLGAEFPKQSNRPIEYASSTNYALTFGAASTRILATSTRNDAVASLGIPATVGRSAVRIEAINCGSSGTVWLNFNDVPAASSTVIQVTASSTDPLVLGQKFPVVNGSIRAFAATADCQLRVTEVRTEN